MIKVLVLAVALGLLVPLAVWLRGGDVFGKRVWILFGFLPFLLPAVPHLDVGIVSWGADWPGLLNGLEVTIIDILAAAIYLGLPRGRGDAVFRVFLVLYFAAVVLSVFQADEPVAASFYVWQFSRAILLTTVVFRACADEIVLANLCRGMVLGLALQAVVVIWQRFGLGIVQTSGTFFHQNTLGLVTHFVVFPQVALLLAGQRGWQVVVAPLAGIVVVALAASRGALLYAALGIALIFAISALRHWTFRKSVIAVAGGLLLLAFAPIVATSFEKRFEAAPLTEDEYDERAAFNRTAAYILEDHPLGVGVNHYVYMAKNFGYSDRGGVAPVEGSRNNIVHNVYWLTAAETGYFGLVALLLMLAYPLVRALQVGWRTRGDRRGDLLLGLGTALLMVYGHSTIEYILLAKEAQYLQAMIVGITLGLVGQLSRRAGPAAADAGWPVAAVATPRLKGA